MKFTKNTKTSGNGGDGSNLFLRLKDGEEINIIPRGEVYEFYSVFGKKGEALAGDPGAKQRYKMNVIVNEGGVLKAKILEFGPQISDQMATYADLIDVTTMKFKLSRSGTGMATQWTVTPLPKEPISPKLMATIEAIPLHILDRKKSQARALDQDGFPSDFGDPSSPPPPFPSEMDSEDLPF